MHSKTEFPKNRKTKFFLYLKCRKNYNYNAVFCSTMLLQQITFERAFIIKFVKHLKINITSGSHAKTTLFKCGALIICLTAYIRIRFHGRILTTSNAEA